MSQRKTQELDWKKLPLAWQKKSVWEIDFISILIANQIDQKGFKEADTGPVQTAHKAQQQLWPGCVAEAAGWVPQGWMFSSWTTRC